MKMSDETRCKVRYKRVSTDLYIGRMSLIGTCIYRKGNMYGKGNVSLTQISLEGISIRIKCYSALSF